MATTKPTNDNIYKQYTPPSTGGDFLKFEDGKEYKLRVASEPYVYLDTFTNKATGESKTSTKYAWIVWNFTASAAQILQLPVTGFRALQAVASDDDWGDPQSYNVNIKRTGTGKDTRYNVIPTPNKDTLDKEQSQAVEDIDLMAAIPNAVPMRQVVGGEPLVPRRPRRLPLMTTARALPTVRRTRPWTARGKTSTLTTSRSSRGVTTLPIRSREEAAL